MILLVDIPVSAKLGNDQRKSKAVEIKTFAIYMQIHVVILMHEMYACNLQFILIFIAARALLSQHYNNESAIVPYQVQWVLRALIRR